MIMAYFRLSAAPTEKCREALLDTLSDWFEGFEAGGFLAA
jgi:hypothetical protein